MSGRARLLNVAMLAAAVTGIVLAVRLPAQGRFDAVRMRAFPAGPRQVMLAGAGGNIGVWYGSDGVVLIDDQFAPLADKLRAAVDSVSGGKPIRFVLNTHWHGDHTGGNEKLAAAGAVIIAHDNARRRLTVAQFRSFAHDTIPAAPPGAWPIVTFDDSLTFHLNGEEARCFHVAPAHTDGDVIVYFPGGNVVHMGDTFFNGIYPVIDISTGGTINGMIAADDRVLALIGPDTRVIPGHGPLGDKAALQAFRDMLATVRDRIAPQIKAGKTLQQIQAAKPLADLDDKWGKGFIKADGFIEVVFNDLSRRR